MKITRARTDGKRMRYTVMGEGAITSHGGTTNVTVGFVDEAKNLHFIAEFTAEEVNEVLALFEAAKRRKQHGG